MSNAFHKTWRYSYGSSPTGIKASRVQEPYEGTKYGNKGMCATFDDAFDGFGKALEEHVNVIINNIKKYSNNKTLKTRLKKYKRDQALHMLEDIEKMVSELKHI